MANSVSAPSVNTAPSVILSATRVLRPVTMRSPIATAMPLIRLSDDSRWLANAAPRICSTVPATAASAAFAAGTSRTERSASRAGRFMARVIVWLWQLACRYHAVDQDVVGEPHDLVVEIRCRGMADVIVVGAAVAVFLFVGIAAGR